MGRIEKTEKGLSQMGCLVEVVATKNKQTIILLSMWIISTMTNIRLQLRVYHNEVIAIKHILGSLFVM